MADVDEPNVRNDWSTSLKTTRTRTLFIPIPTCIALPSSQSRHGRRLPSAAAAPHSRRLTHTAAAPTPPAASPSPTRAAPSPSSHSPPTSPTNRRLPRRPLLPVDVQPLLARRPTSTAALSSPTTSAPSQYSPASIPIDGCSLAVQRRPLDVQQSPSSSSHCRDSASTGAPSSSRSGSPSQSSASKSPKKVVQNQEGVALRWPSLSSDSVARQPSPLTGHGRPSPPT